MDGVTILMRLSTRDHTLHRDEEKQFICWLRSVDIDPESVFAAAIEALDDEDAEHVLHLAEYVRGDGGIVLDPATGAPRESYRQVRVPAWSWPMVRAWERMGPR